MIGQFKKELPYKMNGKMDGKMKLRWADYVQPHSTWMGPGRFGLWITAEELYKQYKVARLLELIHF